MVVMAVAVTVLMAVAMTVRRRCARLCDCGAGRPVGRKLSTHPNHLPSGTGSHRELVPVLLCQLLVDPLLELRFRLVDRDLPRIL